MNSTSDRQIFGEILDSSQFFQGFDMSFLKTCERFRTAEPEHEDLVEVFGSLTPDEVSRTKMKLKRDKDSDRMPR